MPIDIQPLTSSSISTKWKEPYASASLNRRPVGITPAGIYRGLVLAPDPLTGDRTVLVVADPTKGDHVAVFETEGGYSLNYRDGASGDITISLSAYLNVQVVLCIFVDYEVGSSTVGTFRTYTQSEFNGLATSFRDTLVVLGTVTIPVAPGPILAGGISLNGRTLASSNIQKGLVQNPPLARNPNFEIGSAGETDKLSSRFWEKASTAGSGTWNTSTLRADSGTKSIQLSVSSGPFTGRLSQALGIETTFGELFPCTISVWQDKTISSGAFQFYVKWTDANGDELTESVQDLDGGAVDTDWRVINPIFSAPSGAVAVRSFGVRAVLLDPSSTGIFAYIDSINVFVEPTNPQLPYAFDQRFRQRLSASALQLMDDDSNFAAQTANVRYDPALPSGEGTVIVEQSNSSDAPPALGLPGRIIELGTELLAVAADAYKPRITALPADSGVSTHTLMWESHRAGTRGMRMYSGANGATVFTSNARWEAPNWIKDVNGTYASRLIVANAGKGLTIQQQEVGVNSWADGAWTTNLLDFDDASQLMSVAGAVDAGGNIDSGGTIDSAGLITGGGGVTAATDTDMTVSGTGLYKHGDRRVTIPLTPTYSGFDTANNFALQNAATAPYFHYWYWNSTAVTGSEIVLSIPVEDGMRIKEVRFWCTRHASLNFVCNVWYSTGTITNGVTLGTLTTPSGTGYNQHDITGINHTVDSNNFYYVGFHKEIDATATVLLSGVSMLYDRP